MQTFELFSFLLLVGTSKGLHLPKIFKDEMVLQASSKGHPVRTIWGFLDGVSSKVELSGLCYPPNGTVIDYDDEFVPKPVSMKDAKPLGELFKLKYFSGHD